MEKVKQAFDFWMSQYPGEPHPLDQQRFYAIVDAAVESGEYVDSEWLEAQINNSDHKSKLDSTQIADFVDSFDHLVSYANYKKNN
jgi:hypothetical protein